MHPNQHIFLSPHYDDAALSCGGLMAQLDTAGEFTVAATLLGGKPDYTRLSPFARMIHGRPLAGQDPIDQRRAEERHALALLGAGWMIYRSTRPAMELVPVRSNEELRR